jgi:serine protease Do
VRRLGSSSSSDTALAVLGPNGAWHCNDDTDGNNPDVTVAPSAPGTYRVWVTSYSQATADATLGITEVARSR